MKRFTDLSYLLALLLMLSACVKEDTEKCVLTDDVDLQFLYNGDGMTDIFQDKIKQVNLYIYDENERIIQKQLLTHEKLLQKQGVIVRLPVDHSYHVVCWGNADEHSRFATEEIFEKARLVHSDYDMDTKSPKTIGTMDSLYHSQRTFSIPKRDYDTPRPKAHIFPVPYKCAHIDFVVGVKINGVDRQLPVGIRMKGLPVSSDFAMTNGNEQETFVPQSHYWAEEETTFFRFSTLRLKDNIPATIEVYNTSTQEPLYTLSLPEYLQQRGESMENHEETTIAILIEINSGYDEEFDITVKSWDHVDLIPEL